MKHFDYIIAGGGCSGRSLAVRMLSYLKTSNKQVLLVDKVSKKENDKTWCFWEKHPDVFEPAVYRKWNHLSFFSPAVNEQLNICPYQYKMIRAADFYAHTEQQLSENNQVSIIQGNVEKIYTEKEQAFVVIDGETFSTDYVFSSIPQIQEKRPDRYQYLLQHFEGWTIETKLPVFDPDRAILMDFNTVQQGGTSFIYVLPLSANLALVEYTVFSENELPAERYTAALKQYIREQLNCQDYCIKEQEKGVIPMSDHPLKQQENRIIYLGTAGGFTKGSTGYTFRFIQKHTAAIVEQLLKSGNPHISAISPKRFDTYDATLLHLLSSRRLSGEEIFSTMFKKNNPVQILKFLDNETTLMEEIQIFRTLQKKAFALALLNRSLKLIKTS
ncbi:lycopene cyclase family protein [Pedobacter caeni]|uniref:Lycopene beta-cyclase n=1 Tax=Pedobacter caeni TaxID=288992 RepID=A0A1M4TZS0_9SPHI|nr:lycopene cyclase family protein [Pedobacter caeni]SHE49837.1 lycopene beta-cyclase [Pedobacter caeni]